MNKNMAALFLLLSCVISSQMLFSSNAPLEALKFRPVRQLTMDAWDMTVSGPCGIEVPVRLRELHNLGAVAAVCGAGAIGATSACGVPCVSLCNLPACLALTYGCATVCRTHEIAYAVNNRLYDHVQTGESKK